MIILNHGKIELKKYLISCCNRHHNHLLNHIHWTILIFIMETKYVRSIFVTFCANNTRYICFVLSISYYSFLTIINHHSFQHSVFAIKFYFVPFERYLQDKVLQEYKKLFLQSVFRLKRKKTKNPNVIRSLFIGHQKSSVSLLRICSFILYFQTKQIYLEQQQLDKHLSYHPLNLILFPTINHH